MSRRCRYPRVDRANRWRHRSERREHLVPLAPMHWLAERRLRLQELLRGLQVLWRSREHVERARGGERQAIQQGGKNNVKVFGSLVGRQMPTGRQNKNLETALDPREPTEPS